MFGDELRALRFSSGFSLRDFCKTAEEDPSNWSKIERGLMPPPVDHQRLKKIAAVLKVKKEEINDFISKAEIAAGSIPKFVMTNDVLLDQLPAFLRTVDNIKPSEEDFRKIIDLLQRGSDAQ
ncbi:MAG: helix-turn-helix transcriptional regulator [bacterium]|jgi:transcriptional regulator with XRE-family HTH domain|uniref:Putative Helix-turn-helix domain protein n=1 Tax=uncultured Spirochaetota bacterium TaxID=460511 RepID=A0A652ZX77_9SPIR|nr:putative Helix-turn-helix domain protein [uncultured Spirochaetota bacterium]